MKYKLFNGFVVFILGLFWAYSGLIRFAGKPYSGLILGLFWAYSFWRANLILGLFWAYSRKINFIGP
jgi:hypothetical protein